MLKNKTVNVESSQRIFAMVSVKYLTHSFANAILLIKIVPNKNNNNSCKMRVKPMYKGFFSMGVKYLLDNSKIKIKELVQRIKNLALKKSAKPIEIILALNPTTEGDTTGLYLEKLLKPSNAKITKLNRGLSTGSDLEYADETTLINALKYRH